MDFQRKMIFLKLEMVMLGTIVFMVVMEVKTKGTLFFLRKSKAKIL